MRVTVILARLLRYMVLCLGLCAAASYARTQSIVGNSGQIISAEVVSPPVEAVESEEVGSSPSTVYNAGPDAEQIRASGTVLSPDFINFGYLQNTSVLPYLQYEALTHIATTFVDFLDTGFLQNPSSFTDRSSYLKLNGAAHRAGTKVILCVRNDNFDESVLASVMLDPVKRTRLVTAVRNLVVNDTYCQGVNFDFEMVWGSSVRDGISAFLQEMRAALPNHEISVYTHAIYRSDRWNIPAIVNSIDYMLYSTYDWGTGMAPHANADFDNNQNNIASYLDAGLPPEKMVLTWVTYGRRWYNTTDYNQAADGAKQSQGFYYSLFDTTLRRANGGPFVSNYMRGDEIGWYKYTEAGRNYVTVWETPESLEYKITSALNFPGSLTGKYSGTRFRGVGWWSLAWPSNLLSGFQSYDPVAGATVSRPPYYRHIDLMVQEILKSPGQKQHLLHSFEAGNLHWRDPNESPDTTGDTDGDSSFAHVAAPSGIGRPVGSINAGRLIFDFEASLNNKVFLRFELLNHPAETAVTDTNATLAPVSKNTRIRGHYYVSGNYSARTMRLALVDANRQLEVSNPRALPSSAGWHTFEWDLNDPLQIQGRATLEPALLSGNGIVDTKAPGARDISLVGFIIEGGGAGAGTVYFDELTYEDRAPEGKAYVINEFRYSDPGTEFIEIAGPPGPFPTDMQFVMYNSADGSVANAVSLTGRIIPASGLFVIGDTGVSGTGGATGFVPAGWGAASNIPATAPGSLQLYGSTSGYVYDSVVHSAFGGLGDLMRAQTRRVTGEGYGWIGNAGPGLSSSGQPYTMGRIPDGADTNVNQRDFSFMPPTPGQPNGAADLIGALLDFSSLPPGAFQTYQDMKFMAPAPGIPASPGGGNVYRCVDTTGGGVIGVFGDALTGAEYGLDVTGKLYIPASGHQAQAVAVGIGGTKGSTFFSAAPAGSGYEDGYWLVYEHGTVNLNDGQPNHPGHFQFILASNDNQDFVISTALGPNRNLAQVSASMGTWVNFRLRLDATAPWGQQLIAQINGMDVYRGSIPAGGRTSGAFMTGHRETGGGVATTEGTWIDDLLINYANSPTRVDNFELY